MARMNLTKTLVVSALLFSCSIFAAAPAKMTIINSTGLMTDAYVHGNASPNVLLPHSSFSVPWGKVTKICHNTQLPMLQSSDPCAFEVYATNDPANLKQIDVGTVTMYLSDGHVVNINNKGSSYGLKIVALSPGQFELDDF